MHISLQNFITILKINRFSRGLALFSHEKKQLNFQIEGQFLLLQKFNHVVHANLVQMLMLQLYKFKKQCREWGKKLIVDATKVFEFLDLLVH